MRIVTLIENLVYQQGLIAEHGLSIYIETESTRILFDTGQSGLFLQNAKIMGVNVEEIDTLILSHGHYDHTGGLYPFLEKNKKARVYAKKDIFTPKYRNHNRFIGTIFREEILKERLFFIDEITEIADDIFLMPKIKVSYPIDTHFAGLNKMDGNEFLPDEFEDELFLTIKHKRQIHIITACSHRGITNICNTATEFFQLPVGLILGGFHLKDCSSDQFDQIIQYFWKLKPISIGVCHCTGVERYVEMKGRLVTNLFYNNAGHEINL
jgi:7,8-dihydropterin-6-yl-methyl-4-(beta-D-ribofuranosyl)aminobenzene 5'-phosphate synthase